jgi:sugar/nucleoside kinase (ribokinase family)
VNQFLLLGDLMVDVMVQPLSNIAPTSDTPSNIRFTRGGASGNIACAIAEAKSSVTYAAVSGDDWGSQLARADFLQHGVTPHFFVRDLPTGTVVAIVNPDGQRAMLTDRGANAQLTTALVDELFSEIAAEHFHLSGYELLDPATRPAGYHALKTAHARAWSTSLDACSLAPLRAAGPHVILSVLPWVTRFFCNEEEAVLLTGASSVDEALTILLAQCGEVIITLGSRGALAGTTERRHYCASQASSVVDTTGAGDAATGAYLVARFDECDIDESLDRAMTAAARVVAELGATRATRD